ncbi:MAG: archaemetzincin family Zn-dependent metalloprotease [Parcubacteria group bacterium]|nr:archaemetzincin family Zn-dependent metalloprotease [Parcubacteria group bacterium]
METLYILPLGDIDKDSLRRLGSGIKDILPLSIRVLDKTDLPAHTYNKARQQYNSSQIIREMSLYDFGSVNKVLGVSVADLYSTDLSFVFGEAEAPGRTALISLKRLDPQFYKQETDNKVLEVRTLKEAMHELGHTYSLSHCPDKGCVMYYAQSIEDVDNKGDIFCPRCQKLYEMYNS